MWLFPTRGRPDYASRLFAAGEFSTSGVMLLDEDNAAEYDGVSLPKDWQRIVMPRMSSAARLNEAFRRFPAERWYGVVSDDVLPVTPRWDAILAARAVRDGICWSNDNFKLRAVTVAMSGDLARRLGWVCCPAIQHFYGDDAWELIARHVGGGLASDVVVSHEHWQTGRMPKDRTYLERPAPASDCAKYAAWLLNEWPDVLAAITAEPAPC